jgi:hypothetical protein
MGLNRYYGSLMYCTYLPFSIDAPDEKEALEQLKKNAPQTLSEAEQKELFFHLTRIERFDRVTAVKLECTPQKIATPNSNQPKPKRERKTKNGQANRS